MKRIIQILVTVVLVVAILVTPIAMYRQVVSLRSEIAGLKTITRVVEVAHDGEVSRLTLSLTPQGWFDFIRTYDDPGATISNFDFEALFEFEPVEFTWDQEVETFLKKEKSTFNGWKSVKGYDDGSIYCGDFVVYHEEYRDGIKFLFKNEVDGIEVETVLFGAMHAKTIYNFIGGGQHQYKSLYYLVFEDEEGVKAINDEFEVFILKPLQY